MNFVKITQLRPSKALACKGPTKNIDIIQSHLKNKAKAIKHITEPSNKKTLLSQRNDAHAHNNESTLASDSSEMPIK